MFQPVIICILLIYGAITDYKRREISNFASVGVVLSNSRLTNEWIGSILSLTIVAIVFWLTAKGMKHPIPGGDFKLLCALGFACGLLELLLILLLAGTLALVIGAICHRPIGRNIPLCTYIAPSYIILLCAKGVMLL